MLYKLLSILLLTSFFTYTFQSKSMRQDSSKNVLGTPLQSCCTSPMTGYYRNGHCETGADDFGTHVVCAYMTQDFLDFTAKCGNDLCTPIPAYNFPGLKPGDKWCLCASRWKQAYEAGKAPKVVLESTHEKALTIISQDILKEMAWKK